jgi:hypothetical protein
MYIPETKNNYLAFHGLTGYLWCNKYSIEKMIEKLGLSDKQWRLISEKEKTFFPTYSEKCNATDFFNENVKSEEDFDNFWKQIKEQKADFEFEQTHHNPIFIGKMY